MRAEAAGDQNRGNRMSHFTEQLKKQRQAEERRNGSPRGFKPRYAPALPQTGKFRTAGLSANAGLERRMLNHQLRLVSKKEVILQ
jgi:hypothetical protein